MLNWLQNSALARRQMAKTLACGAVWEKVRESVNFIFLNPMKYLQIWSMFFAPTAVLKSPTALSCGHTARFLGSSLIWKTLTHWFQHCHANSDGSNSLRVKTMDGSELWEIQFLLLSLYYIINSLPCSPACFSWASLAELCSFTIEFTINSFTIESWNFPIMGQGKAYPILFYSILLNFL